MTFRCEQCGGILSSPIADVAGLNRTALTTTGLLKKLSGKRNDAIYFRMHSVGTNSDMAESAGKEFTLQELNAMAQSKTVGAEGGINATNVDFAHIYVYDIDMPNRYDIQRVFELAASQWGLFTTAQAIGEGASRTQLSRMAANGRIEPASYGVYRMADGEETAHAPVKAAWLSLHPKLTAFERLRSRPHDAVVSGRTAACMHGDASFYEAPFAFDVPAPKRTSREDVVLRPWPVDESDVVMVEGLPVTSVERTTADLVRGREDPSLVGGFIAGACSRGHVLDEARLASLLSPLAARNGFAKGDGSAFARKLASDYAAEAQVQYALETMARILQGAEADSATRERFREAVETLMKSGDNPGRRR